MIGPPGLPKLGRRVFSFAAAPAPSRLPVHAIAWAAGLYIAGVLAHFSHFMALGLPAGMSLADALTGAPVSLVWPADLIRVLITLS